MAQPEVFAGMAAAAAAAACFDGAVILQAREAREVGSEHALRLSLLRDLATRPRWVLGTVIAVLGWPLQLLAFALAPVTVVQPTLALGMLLLLAAGARLLGERVGRRECLAAAVVVVGVALLGVGSPRHTEGVPSATAMAVTVVVLGGCAVLPFLLDRRRSGAWPLILAAGSAFALASLTGKLLTVELSRGALWAALAFAGATVAAAGLGFLIDMTAMQRFAATRVAPPMFVLETAVPVALAPVLFGEDWGQTPGGGALVALGLLLVLGGGGVLGSARTVASYEQAASAGDEPQDGVGGARAPAVPAVRPPR
jgi:drug/metabolite transporter (DMT)-like permease